MATNPLEDEPEPSRAKVISATVRSVIDPERPSPRRTFILILIVAGMAALAPLPFNVIGAAAAVALASTWPHK